MNEQATQALYNNLTKKIDGFTMQYDDFVKMLEDEQNRRKLHANMQKRIAGFTMDYNAFNERLGYNAIAQADSQQAVEQQQQPINDTISRQQVIEPIEQQSVAQTSTFRPADLSKTIQNPTPEGYREPFLMGQANDTELQKLAERENVRARNLPRYEQMWQQDNATMDKIIDEAKTRSGEAAGKVANEYNNAYLYSGMSGGTRLAMKGEISRAANAETDPAKLSSQLINDIASRYEAEQEMTAKDAIRSSIIEQSGADTFTDAELNQMVELQYKDLKSKSTEQLAQEAGISTNDLDIYIEYVNEQLQRKFRDIYMPKDNWEYFARKVVEGNLIGQAVGMLTKPVSQRQYEMQGTEAYAQENAGAGITGINIGAEVTNVITDPLMWIMPGIGEAAGRIPVNIAGRRLLRLGLSDGALAAERAAMQRGVLRTTQRLMSGMTTMAGLDVGHSIVGQLYQSGEVNWSDVGASGLRGAITGAAFVPGHFLGESVQKYVSDTWNRTMGLVAGKSTQFAAGTNVMVGTAAMQHIMQGGSLEDFNWGDEYLHAGVMQLFFDTQGGLKVAAKQKGFGKAWETLKRDPFTGHLTKDEYEQLNNAGIAGRDAYTILKNLNGGKEFTNFDDYYKVISDISANENIDTQTKYKLASLLAGNITEYVHPIYVDNVVRDYQGKYIVRTYDDAGLTYETRKFDNERKAQQYWRKQYSATRSNFKNWMEGVISTYNFTVQVKEVTDEAIRNVVEGFGRSREDAIHILNSDPNTLTPVERAIRKQIDKTYQTKEVKGTDIISEIREQVSNQFKLTNPQVIRDILSSDFKELPILEKLIYDAYIDELGKRMPRRQVESEPQKALTPYEQIEQQVKQEVLQTTHQADGNIYQVSEAGNSEKQGYIIDGAVPTIDESDPNHPRITNNEVVTVRWSDGSVTQVSAKDLDIAGAPQNAQEQIAVQTEAQIQATKIQVESMNAFHAGDVVTITQDGQVFSSRIVSVSDEGVEVEIENPLTGQPDTMILPHDVALENLQPQKPQEPEETQHPAEQGAEPAKPDIQTMNATELAAATVEYLEGDKMTAKAYLQAELAKAKKALKDAQGKKVRNYANIADFKRQNDAIAAEQKAAQALVSKLESAVIEAANYKTEAERAAAAAEQARQAEIREKRRQTEEGKAGTTPAEKWNGTQKATGNAVTRTLPDGTKIKGHYVLAEAGTATPSHDPFNNWNTSEGFPTTEDGRNINDRDYKNDKDAQQITQQIARTYDGQAVEQVPVVSSEGIVYDGNGRTIAGHIAAANNTDAAYLQALAENAANFGFSPEQLAQFQHPRVYLQLDEDLPYNTTTFAKFNAQEKKTQGSTARAISNSKKLTDAARDGLLQIIDNYGTLDTFFASEKGADEVIKSLLNNGIISQQEVAGLTEQTDKGYLLNPAGKDYVTDLLLGALFDEQTIKLLGSDKGLKQAILRALPAIVENRRLGDYALTDNINGAIRLLYEARRAGMTYGEFIRQTNAFEGAVADRYSAFEMLLAQEMQAGVEQFRDVLRLYNKSAADEANGQTGMFAPRTPEDIKQEILNYYGKRQSSNATSNLSGRDESARGNGAEPPTKSSKPQTEPTVQGSQRSDGQEVMQPIANSTLQTEKQGGIGEVQETVGQRPTGTAGVSKTTERIRLEHQEAIDTIVQKAQQTKGLMATFTMSEERARGAVKNFVREQLVHEVNEELGVRGKKNGKFTQLYKEYEKEFAAINDYIYKKLLELSEQTKLHTRKEIAAQATERYNEQLNNAIELLQVSNEKDLLPEEAIKRKEAARNAYKALLDAYPNSMSRRVIEGNIKKLQSDINKLQKQIEQEKAADEPKARGTDDSTPFDDFLHDNLSADEFKEAQDLIGDIQDFLNSKFTKQAVEEPRLDDDTFRKARKLTVLLIKAGMRKFADYCRIMIGKFGDAIRSSLRELYMAAKSTSEAAPFRKEMDTEDYVYDFDVDNFDKQPTQTDNSTSQSAKNDKNTLKSEKKAVTLQVNKNTSADEQKEQQRQIDFINNYEYKGKKGVEAVIDRYIDKNGNKLDPDELRKIFSEIGYDGTNVPQFKAIEGQIRNALYDEMLRRAVASGNNSVVFVSGCAGSGKTRSLDPEKDKTNQAKKDIKQLTDKAGVVFDAPLASWASIDKVIEKATDAGIPTENITIIQVYNDVETNFQNTLVRGVNTGRVLSLQYFIGSFTSGKGKLQALQDNLPQAKVICIDNRNNNGGQIVDIEEAKAIFDYDITDKQIDKLLIQIEAYVKRAEEGKGSPDKGGLTPNQLATIADRLSEVGTGRPQLERNRIAGIEERVRRLGNGNTGGGRNSGSQEVQSTPAERVRLKSSREYYSHESGAFTSLPEGVKIVGQTSSGIFLSVDGVGDAILANPYTDKEGKKINREYSRVTYRIDLKKGQEKKAESLGYKVTPANPVYAPARVFIGGIEDKLDEAVALFRKLNKAEQPQAEPKFKVGEKVRVRNAKTGELTDAIVHNVGSNGKYQLNKGKEGEPLTAENLLSDVSEELLQPAIKHNETIGQFAKRVAETNKKKGYKADTQQATLDLFGDEDADNEQDNAGEAPKKKAGEIIVGRPRLTNQDQHHGYKIGDKVIFRSKGSASRKPEVVEIVGFEKDGKPTVNSFGTSYITEIADWDDIEPLNKDNNEQRTVSQRPQRGNGRVGEKEQPQTIRPDTIGVDNNGGEYRGNDRIRSGSVSEPLHQPTVKKNTHNFNNKRGNRFYATDSSVRVRDNVEAIRILRELQESGGKPTKEQQDKLARFTGWGGLGSIITAAENERWSPLQPLAKELKDTLLSEEEWQALINASRTAFYTPVEVIDTLWDVAKQLGFKGGKVLEGSAGIGNILAQTPTDISSTSDFQAVEYDPTTAAILSYLYPDAQTHSAGFQDIDIKPNSVDLAITNVPFGKGNTFDKNNPDLNFSTLQDFCIAKNVRALKEGGIAILISTSGTLENSPVRNWISTKGNADIIGAFRLNNATFGEATDVTSDIIIVRKRINGEKSTQAINVMSTGIGKEYKDSKGKVEARVAFNQYFINHPEFMGGEMDFVSRRSRKGVDRYGKKDSTLSCFPIDDTTQAKRLAQWAKYFKAEEQATAAAQVEIPDEDTQLEDCNIPDALVGSMQIDSNGRVCRVTPAGKMKPLANQDKVKGHTRVQCVREYQQTLKALDEVLAYQQEHDTDEGLQPLLQKLNLAFNSFRAHFGTLSNLQNNGKIAKNVSLAWLRRDARWADFAALEIAKKIDNPDGTTQIKFETPSVLTQRIIKQQPAFKPQNNKDGAILSIQQKGKLDLDFIAQQLGKTKQQVRNEMLDEGIAFADPITDELVISYEYLSGNVRNKLKEAEAKNENGKYDKNIEELKKRLPISIPFHLINITCGATYIPESVYVDFLAHKLGSSDRGKEAIKVHLVNNSLWIVDNKDYVTNDTNNTLGVYSSELNRRWTFEEIFTAALHDKTIQAKGKRKIGKEEVTIYDQKAQEQLLQKIEDVKEEFVEWYRERMQSDSEVAGQLETIYNERYNNFAPLRVTDDFIPTKYEGQVSGIELRSYQKHAVAKAVAHNTMVAHEVGTGKTFTMITTAMEMRRIGMAKKPMIVVQKATIGQFAQEAKRLYPNAKILALNKDYDGADGRKEFLKQIKYNDWDIVIITQPALDKIPDSPERQKAYISEKIQEIQESLELAKEQKADDKVIEQLEKQLDDAILASANISVETAEGGIGKKKTAADLKKEAERAETVKGKAQRKLDRSVDDVKDFDDLGIDALFVDEAHAYKKLGFSTLSSRDIRGIDSSASKRAVSLYLKTRAIYDKAGGYKNVIFATGTPITNTAAECWTYMRYLMPKEQLQELGIHLFDAFRKTFGEIVSQGEMKTSGQYQETKRFSKYNNVAELLQIWSQIADTVLQPEENKKYLPKTISATETNEQAPNDVFLKMTPGAKSIIKWVFSEYDRYYAASKKEQYEMTRQGFHLKMFKIAKMAAIDIRLVSTDPNTSDEPGNKTNQTVEMTLKALEKTKAYRGTVAIFCDKYRNTVTGFNVFEEMKRKLVEIGVPENEIAIVSGKELSDDKKTQIFEDVREGKIRVIMGTTQRMGIGVNIQDRLQTLIHMDAPDMPMEYTQRNGRIIRQGNLHAEWGLPVDVVRLGAERSLDTSAFQRLKTKNGFIEPFMNQASTLTSGKEIDPLAFRLLEEDSGIFDNPVAELSGSSFLQAKTDAVKQLRKLINEKASFEQTQNYARSKLSANTISLQSWQRSQARYTKQLELIRQNFGERGITTIAFGDKPVPFSDTAVQKVLEPIRKEQTEINKDLASRSYSTVNSEYDIQINSNNVHILITKERAFEGSNYVTHTTIAYKCPELFGDEAYHKGYQKMTALPHLIEDIQTQINVSKIEGWKNKASSEIQRISQENEKYKKTLERTFDNSAEVEKIQMFIDELDIKIEAEIEAARRELNDVQEANASNITADFEEDTDTPEAQYDELDYDPQNLTPAQQLATDAVVESLRGTTGLDITIDADETDMPDNAELMATNNAFNEELQQQIEGKLPTGHIYQLGMPSVVLRSTGFPNEPIELSSTRLKEKSQDPAHPFDLKDVRGLVEALQHPLAVFKYGDSNKSQNVIVELHRDGKNFLVGVHFNQNHRGTEVSDIRGILPKDNAEWLNWITQGKLLYADKEKLQTLIDQQRINLAEVDYLDLESVAKVLQIFENPKLSEENNATTEFSIRQQPAPKKTGIGYKVFYRGKDGKLYPPMVANPNGADTPIGVWLDADAAPITGESKTGRPHVKAGGKGTQGGSGQLAYRPGWHLGEIPYALQFNRKDAEGNKTLFPKDFVWAEVEYAADNDYQQEAEQEGMTENGKYRHSYAGLKHLPTNGFYRYRTNPNPDTDPWIITGAIKVNRILTNEKVDDIVRKAGREPQQRELMKAAGKLFGWAQGNTIHLTKDGINPNSPVHEYSHLWIKAIQKNNNELYQNLQELFSRENLPQMYEELDNDPNYADLSEEGKLSEVFSRFSGRRGAERMEEEAKEMMHEAVENGSKRKVAQTATLIQRMKALLKKAWDWIGEHLFNIKNFGSREEAADRALYDLLNQTDLNLDNSDTQIEKSEQAPQSNLTRSEIITQTLVERSKENYKLMMAAAEKVSRDLKGIHAAMQIKSDFDRNQVAMLLNLANTMMRSQWGAYMPHTTSMIMTQIRNAVGKRDITKEVNLILDYLVDAQAHHAKEQWKKLLATKTEKINISGVVSQGKVAIQGQHALKALNEALGSGMTAEQLDEQIAEYDNLASYTTDSSKRLEYEGRRTGYMMAQNYIERVQTLQQERQQLNNELTQARGKEALSFQARRELEQSIKSAMRENMLEQSDAYIQCTRNLQNYIEEQHEAARDFIEKQNKNREKIRSYATLDLAGVVGNPNRLRTKLSAARSVLDTFTSPIRELQSLLRMCGLHAPDGEGYLYNHFMRGWTDAADKERKGIVEAQQTLDNKIQELTNGKYKTWEEAATKIKSASKKNYSVNLWTGEFDGATPIYEETPITAGNALYIYAVNKMTDGQMKLRAMNIDEATVESLTAQVRDMFGQEIIDVVDWVQSEYFIELRNRYNPTHEALFGAPMDAIDNYFPLRINPNVRQKNEDLGDPDTDASRLLTGTSTGAIKRRTRNMLALDVRNADFFKEVIRHIAQMERWNAFAQLNRDANILFSDIDFRNRIKSMNTIYGTGDKLYNYMKDAFRVAMGTYRSKTDMVSEITLNIAKGVTSAKINFRTFTALKQLASFPAFFTYMTDRTFVGSYLRNWIHPHDTMKWAKEVLPNFEKRISKRDMGDMRLMQRSTDWQWNERILELSSKYGMAANVFFDALTCARGARAVYDSHYVDYLRKGYSQGEADSRARQDAEQAFNTSQQSSEGAYVAPVQQDRNVITAALTVFRTAPIQYTRNFIHHTRNLLRKMKRGTKAEQIEFRTNQYIVDGLSPEQAQQAAEQDYNKSIKSDIIGFVVYGAILNIVWRIAGQIPYLLSGDDDDKKKEMLKESVTGGALVSPITGLLGGGIVEQAIDGYGSVADMFAPEMPFTQDVKRAFRYLENDKYAEFASQALSVLMQSCSGFDPQTAADMIARVVTTLDSEQELTAAQEALLISQALLSIPQSQYEQMLIDGIKKGTIQYNKALSDYQRYQAVHTAPLTWYMRSDEEVKKAEKAAKTRFDKLIKEREGLKQ